MGISSHVTCIWPVRARPHDGSFRLVEIMVTYYGGHRLRYPRVRVHIGSVIFF